jgi:TRAP-type uncharacterized transport system substrate-binding protein
MKGRKCSRMFFVVLLTVSVMFGASYTNVQAGQKVKRFTIGTAGTAGALYPMGVAMAAVISKRVRLRQSRQLEGNYYRRLWERRRLSWPI